MTECLTTLQTVSDYIDQVRVLLLDTVSPYRYDDPSLLTAFNLTLLEGRRLRPDLFVYNYKDTVPHYSEISGDDVLIEEPFRLAFVFGTCGLALQRDQEEVTDERANTFLSSFYMNLIGKVPPQVRGPTQPGR